MCDLWSLGTGHAQKKSKVSSNSSRVSKGVIVMEVLSPCEGDVERAAEMV